MQIRPEKMRGLIRMNVQNRKTISDFLDSGAWPVGKDRAQTRRILIDCLSWIPSGVLAAVFATGCLMVIAPDASSAGSLVSPGREARALSLGIQIVTLDAKLESLTYLEAFAAVQRLLIGAFLRLAASGKGTGKEEPHPDPLTFTDADLDFLKSMNVGEGD